jgi:hypothetical protein
MHLIPPISKGAPMKHSKVFAIAFALLLGWQLVAASPQPVSVNTSLIAKVLKIPEDSIVEVELRDHETLRGRIGKIGSKGFHLQYAKEESVHDRDLTYEQVQSVRKSDPKSNSDSGARTIPEQVLEISAGSLVNAGLKGGEKILGTMGDVSAGGFTLKYVQGAKSRNLAFSEMNSIQTVRVYAPGVAGVADRKFELGATIGIGAIIPAKSVFTGVGMEACVFCQRQGGFFLEYNRWSFTPDGGKTTIMTIASGGVRIQDQNESVKPFFEIGIAVGTFNDQPHNLVIEDEHFNMIGVKFGGGVTISLPKGFYVRPQVGCVVSGHNIGAISGFGFMTANVGLGYRF